MKQIHTETCLCAPTCPSTCWPGRSLWRGAEQKGPRWRPLQTAPPQPGWWCHGTAGWTGTGSWCVMPPPYRSPYWSESRETESHESHMTQWCVLTHAVTVRHRCDVAGFNQWHWWWVYSSCWILNFQISVCKNCVDESVWNTWSSWDSKTWFRSSVN